MFKKLKKLSLIFTEMTQLYDIASLLIVIVLYVFSQLLLLVSFFLPLKVLMLLSLKTLPFQVFDFGRENTIMFLVLIGILVFFIHILFENIIQNLKKNLCKRTCLVDSIKAFEYKYIDVFFRTYTTLVLIVILRATCKFNQAAKPISSKLNFLTF